MMLAYAAMAHTAVDEGKTMLLVYAAMAHVGVDEEIDDDYVGVPVMAHTDNVCK